jgi:hypothetical protein
MYTESTERLNKKKLDIALASKYSSIPFHSVNDYDLLSRNIQSAGKQTYSSRKLTNQLYISIPLPLPLPLLKPSSGSPSSFLAS